MNDEKISFKNLLSKKEWIIVLTSFFIIFFSLVHAFYSGNYYEGEELKKIKIYPGENFSQIVDELEINGIIKSKFNFKVAAFFYGAEKRIRAARYVIPNGLSYVELIDLLTSGKGDRPVKVNIFRGITSKQIIARLKAERIFTSDTLNIEERKLNVLNQFVSDVKLPEGYILPGDYILFMNSNVEEVFKELFEYSFSFYNDVMKSFNGDMNLHEVLTLASIVEGETNSKNEMATVAGVYLNRLKKGMLLQADPTIQYIIDGPWRRLLFRDLNINSPYNTYKFSGLPPTPICSPGKDAIYAVVNPEEHDYLYFVATPDGKHKFSKSLEEHNRYAKEYHQWLNQKKNSKK